MGCGLGGGAGFARGADDVEGQVQEDRGDAGGGYSALEDQAYGLGELIVELRDGGGDDAERQAHGHDDEVAGLGEVHPGERLDTGGRDRPEEDEPRAAEHRQRDGGDKAPELGKQTEQDQDSAPNGDHEPALDVAEPDEPDVLGEGGKGKSVQHSGKRGRKTICAQTPRDVVRADFLLRHLADGENIRGRLDHHDEHDERHGDDGDYREDRQPEVEWRGDTDPRRIPHPAEVRDSNDSGERRPNYEAEQDSDTSQKAAEDASDSEDQDQHPEREGDVTDVAEGIRRRVAAASTVRSPATITEPYIPGSP